MSTKKNSFYIFLFSLIFCFITINKVSADSYEEQEILGWGWIGVSSGSSDTGDATGIISFNCENKDPSVCNNIDAVDYHVSLVKETIDDVTYQYLEGWAWIGSVATSADSYTSGWIRFSGDPNNYLYQNYTGTTHDIYGDEALPEFVQEFVDDETQGNGMGSRYDPALQEVYGWARIMTIGAYGYDKYGANDWGWISLQGHYTETEDPNEVEKTYAVGLFEEYYTSMQTENYNYGQDSYAKLKYYGWNANGYDNGVLSTPPATITELEGTGFGVIQFDLSEQDLESAWFQALYGNIYSKKGINASGPPDAETTDHTNATYLILSGINTEEAGVEPAPYDINDAFISQCGEDGSSACEIEGYANLEIPKAGDGSVYRSSLGKIDIDDLISSTNASAIEVDDNVCAADFMDSDNVLDGKIYYYNSNLNICDRIEIKDAITPFTDGCTNCLGNGTIIVRGDLEIMNDVYYYSYSGEEETTVADLNNLASLAWIVEGNLNISSSVKKVAGAFIVLGDGGIKTGNGSLPLEVSGLMMAKKFQFERERFQESETYYDEGGLPVETNISEPSEKIIYDGRVYTNPPPGLRSFIETLPELNLNTP